MGGEVDEEPPLPAPELSQLWDDLGTRSWAQARERLFSRYLSFARDLARRQFVKRSGADLDRADLEQLACEALLEAIDRYEPMRGVPFEAFARGRILGNIADGVRRSSELREQLAWHRRMERERMASLRAGADEGRSPLDELADLAVGLALGFMLEDAGLIVSEASASNAGSGSYNAWHSLAWSETRAWLARELAGLAERDRLILQYHYVDGVAFEQIARVLELSKGRISQLHRAALTTLKKRMMTYAPFHIER